MEQIWFLIGDANSLASWLDADIELVAVLGGRYRAHHADGKLVGGHVIVLQKPSKLVLSCRVETTPDLTWPVYTTLEIELSCAAQGTELTLVHHGFENLPEAYRDEMFEEFEAFWTAAISRLKKMVLSNA